MINKHSHNKSIVHYNIKIKLNTKYSRVEKMTLMHQITLIIMLN